MKQHLRNLEGAGFTRLDQQLDVHGPAQQTFRANFAVPNDAGHLSIACRIFRSKDAVWLVDDVSVTLHLQTLAPEHGLGLIAALARLKTPALPERTP